MPKVSIIVPLYNKEIYVANTIESILRQTFSDIEVIIVNDGSTDKSAEIVQKYAEADSRIMLISIPNRGVSNARNIGLNYAAGEWIQFLDADDLIDSSYLAQAVIKAEEIQADILFTNFLMVDERGNCKRNITAPYNGAATQKELCDLFMEGQSDNGFFGYISNKLFCRRLLIASGAKFPEEINLAEDLDFYAQLYKKVERAYFMPVNSFYYLQTAENYLNNLHIDYLGQLKVQLDIREWFVYSRSYTKYQQQLNKKISDYAYYSIFYEFEEEQDISEAFAWITGNDLVLSCIQTEFYRGFEKRVLTALKGKKKNRTKRLLKGRMVVRCAYRRIKKHE